MRNITHLVSTGKLLLQARMERDLLFSQAEAQGSPVIIWYTSGGVSDFIPSYAKAG